jgi:hypothetical protein
MKNSVYILFAVVLLTSINLFAKGNQVRCSGATESAAEGGGDDGGPSESGNITIQLDANGKPISVSVLESALKENPDYGTHATPEMRWAFDLKDSKIKRSIQKNKIEEGVEGDDGKPHYQWGIENIEVIEAVNARGQSLRLMINDHSYSGTPGSSVEYKDGNKVIVTSFGQIFCEGPLLLPWND